MKHVLNDFPPINQAVSQSEPTVLYIETIKTLIVKL